MYRWLYKDIYLPGLTPEEESDQVGHLEHCLEGLREGAKCNAGESTPQKVLLKRCNFLTPAL